jgi:hypothetical protein
LAGVVAGATAIGGSVCCVFTSKDWFWLSIVVITRSVTPASRKEMISEALMW